MPMSLTGSPPTFPEVNPPGDSGFVTWAYDPTAATGSMVLVTGDLYLVRLRLFAPAVIHNVVFFQIAKGATLNNCGYCIYGPIPGPVANVSGPGSTNTYPLAVNGTTDRSPGFMDDLADGWVNCPVPNTSLAAGFYAVGLWTNGTTGPTMARGNAQAGMINGTAANAARFALYGSAPANLTPFASSVFVSNCTNAQSLWVGLW